MFHLMLRAPNFCTFQMNLEIGAGLAKHQGIAEVWVPALVKCSWIFPSDYGTMSVLTDEQWQALRYSVSTQLNIVLDFCSNAVIISLFGCVEAWPLHWAVLFFSRFPRLQTTSYVPLGSDAFSNGTRRGSLEHIVLECYPGRARPGVA